MKRVKNYQSVITALQHGLTFATDQVVNAHIIKRYRRYIFLWDDVDEQTATLEDTIMKYAEAANKLYATTQYEYNPIENYDRTEHEESTRTDDLSESATRTDNLSESATRTDNLHEDVTETTTPTGYGVTEVQTPNQWQTSTTATDGTTRTTTETPNNWTQTHSDAGYGSGNTPTTTSTDVTSGSKTTVVVPTGQDSGTVTQSGTFTTTRTQTGSNEVETERDNTGTQTNVTNNTGTQTNVTANTGTQENERDLTVHGNIGTVTTQDMIKQEREIILNCLDWYVDKFREDFDLVAVRQFMADWEEEEEE